MICKKDLDSLNPFTKLNDQAVFAYLLTITHDSNFKSVDSFFYTKIKNWRIIETLHNFDVKGLFEWNAVFIPICEHGHWRLIVFKPKTLELDYYDSMGFDGKLYLEKVKDFIQCKAKDAGIDTSAGIKVSNKACPKQKGTDDCGVHLLLCAKIITKNIEITEDSFSSQDARLARKIIKHELIKWN